MCCVYRINILCMQYALCCWFRETWYRQLKKKFVQSMCTYTNTEPHNYYRSSGILSVEVIRNPRGIINTLNIKQFILVLTNKRNYGFMCSADGVRTSSNYQHALLVLIRSHSFFYSKKLSVNDNFTFDYNT